MEVEMIPPLFTQCLFCPVQPFWMQILACDKSIPKSKIINYIRKNKFKPMRSSEENVVLATKQMSRAKRT